MTFKSKIDWWFYVVASIVGIITVFITYSAFNEKEFVLFLAAFIFIMIMTIIIFPMLLHTEYILENEKLCIRSGLFRTYITYSNIIEAYPNTDFASAPALSLDRIQVRYANKNGVNNIITISPKAKNEFLEELKVRIHVGLNN